MIESLYIMCIAIAFLLFILGFKERDGVGVVYSGTSLILWLMLIAQSFYIQVPLDMAYDEPGFRAFCMVFVFICLIRLLIGVFPTLSEWYKGDWGG